MKFLPVILGADTNAYGIAKSIYQYYQEKSICVSTMPLFMTNHSKIIDVRICKELHDEVAMVDELIRLAKETPEMDGKRILFAASDAYAVALINQQEKLKEYYHLPVIPKEQLQQFEEKEAFYQLCEKHGMPYAKTEVITKDNYVNYQSQLMFPVVLKPSNSVSYFDYEFEGKKKAFIIDSLEEVQVTLNRIYEGGYTDPMILQEFIPGDDSCMRVVNAYVDASSHVQAISIGHPILEDVTPELVGNYVAIISEENEPLSELCCQFLESIQFKGIADIDLKYDERDQQYKIFEVNLRLGRSSYYTTMAGSHLIQQIIADLIFDEQPKEVLKNTKEILWLGVPEKVALEYIEDPHWKAEAKRLIDAKQYGFTLYFDQDSVLRKRGIKKYYNSYIERYQKWFKRKGDV